MLTIGRPRHERTIALLGVNTGTSAAAPGLAAGDHVLNIALVLTVIFCATMLVMP